MNSLGALVWLNAWSGQPHAILLRAGLGLSPTRGHMPSSFSLCSCLPVFSSLCLSNKAKKWTGSRLLQLAEIRLYTATYEYKKHKLRVLVSQRLQRLHFLCLVTYLLLLLLQSLSCTWCRGSGHPAVTWGAQEVGNPGLKSSQLIWIKPETSSNKQKNYSGRKNLIRSTHLNPQQPPLPPPLPWWSAAHQMLLQEGEEQTVRCSAWMKLVFPDIIINLKASFELHSVTHLDKTEKHILHTDF